MERHGTTTLNSTVARPAAPFVSLFVCEESTNRCGLFF